MPEPARVNSVASRTPALNKPRGGTLLLCPELFKAEGGIPRVSRLYLEALTEIEPGRVNLVVLNDSVFPPAELAKHTRTPLVGATACSRSKLRFLLATIAAAGRCDHALATHVHLLPALNMARLRRPRLSMDVVLHGIEAWAPLPRMATRALERTRRIYCVSQYTLERFAALHPAVTSKLRVLPNAIDPRLARELSTLPASLAEPGRILTVSRLAPHDHTKGIDHLIAALPAIREKIPAATLQIVGDGADRPRLEALATNSPARTSITFHGIVNEVRLRSEFARCHVFALPSDKEGFGLVYAEAMAAGRPCIAARAGGAPEVIGDTGGLLVPYADVPALARAGAEALARTWDPVILRRRANLFSLDCFCKNLSKLWLQP